MITGSIALAVYAQPRMTRDLDFVIDLKLDDIDRFLGLFSSDCYIERESVKDAVKNRSMFNIIHNEWIIKADFIVRKNEPYRIREFERKRDIELDEISISIVAPEDLILSKLVWMLESESELQKRDVQDLIRSVKVLDWRYMENWSEKLGVRSLLKKLKK
jgi:hypothetical protein